MITAKPILYAEDDENDVFLMERAFAQLNISNPLRHVDDGHLAVAYLAGSAPFEDRVAHPFPCLLMIDLSMPGRKGLDVLQWIRTQPAISTLPVLVLTSSNQESDIHRAGLLGANGFIVKPGDPDEMLMIVKTIQDYWLTDKPPTESFVDFAKGINVPGLKSPPQGLLR